MQQQIQQPQASGNYDARLGVLENDVAGMKAGIASILQKLDARSGINWAPIAILVTVLSGLGSMGFMWINGGQDRLETLIAKIEARSERYVPREDLDKRFEVITQRRDDLQRLTDARIGQTERDLDALQKALVPRGEHDSYRQLQQRDQDQLRGEVDRVEKRLEKRIDDLDRAGRRPPDR